jgi:hypothetical protein
MSTPHHPADTASASHPDASTTPPAEGRIMSARELLALTPEQLDGLERARRELLGLEP